MQNNVKEIKNNSGLYIYHLKSSGRWCAKIQTGYNVETGKPKVNAFYGKTYNEARLKAEEFNNSITVI